MVDLIGKGVYEFEEKTGVTNSPINVYYFRPTTWNPGDDIAFVMHGTNRDAARYLQDWTTYANEKNILVVCPEFSNEKYPGSGYYNTGNIMNNGEIQDKADWIFSAIDRIVDDVKTKFDSLNSKTLLYGHSAGAQMVHRYAIFDDNTNFDLIISANAGWYTMPDNTISFPYGVGGVSINNEQWRTIFSKPLVVLLGEEDIIRDSNLRVTEQADAQGKNRLERGKTFYEKMENKAKDFDFEFNWKLSTVAQVGHSDYRMAKAAVEIFLETAQSILTLDNSIKSPVTVNSAIKVIDASKRTTAIKIDANKLANTIQGGSGNDKLYGDAGNDKIYGNNGNDKLVGGTGNDSLWGGADDDTLEGRAGNDVLDGGAGNDQLTGGADSDLFIYTAGKDTITDYSADDKISLGSAISKTTLKGSDVVFTVNKSNTLTVKNGKGKTLNIIDSTGKKYSTVVGGTTLTLTNSATSPVTVESSIKVLDASKRTTAIKIDANKLANTILGGSGNDNLYGAAGNDKIYGNDGNDKLVGGNGNDTLYGGAGNDKLEGRTGNDILIGGTGNDSLWGGTGADKFIYASGDGQDVIYGFDKTDLLQITGIFSASYNKSKKEIYFDVGTTKNAITLKDFSATSFNVNGMNYKISGTKLVKK